MAGYGSNEAADSYHQARGNAAWAALSADQKTAARVRGSVYVDGRYGARFPGVKAGGRAQERAWPRIGADDWEGSAISSDIVPIEVEHATYEAALIEAADPGSLSPTVAPSDMLKREKVGPIEQEYFQPGGASDMRPLATIIDDLLAPLIQRSRVAVYAV